MRAGNLDALRPGERVGRYEIVSLLGQGGFGITYRAKDAQLDREVAIKEYLPSLLAVRRGTTELVPRSEETAEDFRWGLGKFIDEGRTLARLGRAPAIVRVHDFLECHGTAYLVMELLQGETLEHRLHRSGTLDVKAVNGLFWPLLDGLARVHATGFLHRDIKPANILVDADGCPTLIDFGASRAAVIGHSAAMTAIFTPGYAAIEQYTSSSQGPWTDIYGLSATVHHAIVGHPPPPAVARILEDAYRPLVALRPAGFDQSFLAGIDAGLSIRASQRPQSIDRWRELLQTRPSDQETADTVHLGRLSRLRRPDRSRAQSRSPPRLLLGALAAIGLAVLGTLAYVAFVPQRMSPSAALEGLQVQELEQVLIQRRKAAAEAAAKQQAEEEAQREAAAEAQRQADEAARRKAAAEAAAKQRAEEEAKRQAAAEAQRQADEATKRKAAAEAAAKQQAEEEAKRQAAAEARRQADEAARRKAAAEAAAKQQAEEEAKRQAAAEAQRQADEAARRKAAAEVA
ncbi:MAG TPA: serine/threonine-protein kinase, partial [Reyranella sp.]|nr:serine/threonine-protein kinase [Reyranella sp.]